MKAAYLIFTISLVYILSACNTKPQNDFHVQTDDFEQYLMATPEQTIREAQANLDFWTAKLVATPTQFPYHAKIAGIESELFGLTGIITHLKSAEEHLLQAYHLSGKRVVGYQRSLAHNYISQHRFKEALDLLELAEANGEKLNATQKMLFDVHLELGNSKQAEKYLMAIQNQNDFDFLIRNAKWEDHNGNLDKAIMYMELALERANSIGSPAIVQWAHTNLADFYGHDGRIADAYAHYLAALSIDPNDAYAKKGLAWIAYSYEKDTKLAMRILNTITEYYHAPDYHLLKAEIAAYNGDPAEENRQIAAYLVAVDDDRYGVMYNTYNIALSAEGHIQAGRALQLAQQEVMQRPTPMSYSFLALAHLNNGEPQKALEIIEETVKGQSTEPVLQYHMAEVYRANAMAEPLAEIKTELLGAAYELGPVMTERIRGL